MQRQYFRLICKDGTVYTCNDAWPGPENIPGKIWLIGYESEIVESFHGLTKTIRPERYYVLMRAADDTAMHGMKNPGACPECAPIGRQGCPACPEETQVIEIPADNVSRVCRVHGFNDATTMFGKMMQTLNADLIPPGEDPDLDEAVKTWVDERFPRLKQFCEVDRTLAREIIELIEVVQAESADAEDDEDDEDEEPAAAKANGTTVSPTA